MDSSRSVRSACCILLPYPSHNWQLFIVGGVVCVANMLLHIYTPKTKMHTKRESFVLARGQWEAFTGRYVAGSIFLEEHWYLLIKFHPTLQ